MAFPIWAFVLIAVGGVLLVLVTLGVFCTITNARRRQRNREKHELRVYDRERARAEATLSALRAANFGMVSFWHQEREFLGRQQQPVMASTTIPSQQTPPVVIVATLPSPVCHSGMSMVGATTAPAVALPSGRYQHHVAVSDVAAPVTQVSMPQLMTPVGFAPDPGNSTAAVFNNAVSQPTIVSSSPPPPLCHVQTQPNEQIRLAMNYAEIPQSVPPIPPAGYVTVPTVRERI